MTRLRRAVAGGEIAAVVFYHPDRFARSPVWLELVFQEFTYVGVRVAFVQGRAELSSDTPEGYLLRALNAQGEFRRRKVTGHLHVRDVQGVAHFVKAKGFAVFGEKGFNFQGRQTEQIAKSIFVFETVEPAVDRHFRCYY